MFWNAVFGPCVAYFANANKWPTYFSFLMKSLSWLKRPYEMDKRFKFGIFIQPKVKRRLTLSTNHSIDLHVVRISTILGENLFAAYTWLIKVYGFLCVLFSWLHYIKIKMVENQSLIHVCIGKNDQQKSPRATKMIKLIRRFSSRIKFNLFYLFCAHDLQVSVCSTTQMNWE